MEISGCKVKEKMHDKDIKSQNTILNSETGEIKITNFGISSLVHWTDHNGVSLNLSEGTPDYISSRQTVRIQDLSKTKQETLNPATCIGSISTLNTLVVVDKKSQYKTVQDPGESITEGLILPSNKNYINVADEKHIKDFPLV